MTEITKNAESIYENFMANFGLTNEEPDVNQLAITGTVSEIEVSEDDCITRIIKYTSNDGKTQFKSTVCYTKDYLINKENRELREQIKTAVLLEDYEWAAQLKGRLRKKS